MIEFILGAQTIVLLILIYLHVMLRRRVHRDSDKTRDWIRAHEKDKSEYRTSMQKLHKQHAGDVHGRINELRKIADAVVRARYAERAQERGEGQ